MINKLIQSDDLRRQLDELRTVYTLPAEYRGLHKADHCRGALDALDRVEEYVSRYYAVIQEKK